MTSYAQNGEDVVLRRAFPDDHVGFYIDVGASDPEVDSVTKHFYDCGWQGINVEPAALALAELKQARRRDVNLGIGIGAEPGEMTFYELPRQMTGCSSFLEELADDYRRQGFEPTARTVEVMTLAALCAEYATDREIDFLKIDVEGNEPAVLAGADFTRFRPRIIVVEATIPGSPTPAYEAWEPAVLKARYRFVLFDGLNRFYVREEDTDELADTLSVPANTFDDYLPHRCVQWREEARALALLKAERARYQDELARAEALLRDARIELNASRDALLAKLGEETVAPPAQ